MKKILIVNNNMDMGGIQKSLVNLLREICGEYDVTLLLFSKSGSLLKDVPDNIRIITPHKCYRMLGLSRTELKKYPLLYGLKYLMMKWSALFSRRSAMKILGVFQDKIKGYDTVISYSHLCHHKQFANGCGDFVLDKVDSDCKICMVHCDYLNSGYLSHRNNLEYAEFDRIACCSDSVRARFVEGAGVDGSKVYAVRNFYDLRAAELAEEDPQVYDEGYINIVIVARLSPEKGVDRAIEALHNAERTDIRYYIIGDGPDKDKLINKTIEYGMTDRVFFLGEQHNSHRYMMNADYLLVPSLHEAAPVVFDEAKTLGLPIISTDTTSAREMLGCSDLICENSLSGIEDTIIPLHKRINLESKPMTNQLQNEQFKQMIGSVSKKEPGDETMEDN